MQVHFPCNPDYVLYLNTKKILKILIIGNCSIYYKYTLNFIDYATVCVMLISFTVLKSVKWSYRYYFI